MDEKQGFLYLIKIQDRSIMKMSFISILNVEIKQSVTVSI